MSGARASVMNWSVIREDWDGEGGWSSVRLTVVVSRMLDLFLSLPPELMFFMSAKGSYNQKIIGLPYHVHTIETIFSMI